MEAAMSDHLVHPEEVDTECRRRIQLIYPDSAQHNIDREGSEDQKRTMQLVINGLRNSAWMLKQMRRIPGDFRDDRYWSGEWRPTSDSMAFGAPQAQQQALPWMQGGMPMMPPWMMMPQPAQAPVVVMQSPPQAAPIVINGAAPQGPMVIQSPTETKVIAAPALAPAQVVAPASLPQPAPLPQQPTGLLPAADVAPQPAPQPAEPGLSQDQFQEWRREQLLVETAQAASNGSDVARQWMAELAAKLGKDVDAYIAVVMA
jgi:hypothetical protein